MKVTKLIREYIEEQINAKYQPAIDAAAKLNADDSTLEQVRADTTKELKELVRNTYKERLAPFYDPDDLQKMLEGRSFVMEPSSYRILPTAEKKRNAALEKLHAARAKAIRSVLLELELGATKADLDRLLAAVNPNMDEEE